MRIDLKKLISPRKRMNKAIELLIHYNLTPVEVAYQLDYATVDEFEKQFRNWVGYSAEEYRELILWDFEKEFAAASRF